MGSGKETAITLNGVLYRLKGPGVKIQVRLGGVDLG
jgi:hypothetical protein